MAAHGCRYAPCWEAAAALAPPTAGLTAPLLRGRARPGSPSRFGPPLSPCCHPELQQLCVAAPPRKPPRRPPQPLRLPGPGRNPPAGLKLKRIPGIRWCLLDNTEGLGSETCWCIISLPSSYASKVFTARDSGVIITSNSSNGNGHFMFFEGQRTELFLGFQFPD